jgi:energy-coupling factor transporter ATP-binding protein EcfA2
MHDEKVTYFAETDFRNQKTKFGIKAKDRTRHMYVIGKTGMGKSTLLENLAIQDIQNDEGIIFIDPHGSAAVKLLSYIPKHRIDDVIYFSPSDTDFPVSFNVLEQVPKDKRNAVASGLMNAFKKIWVDAWSARMEYLLNYSILALLDVPGTTLLGINRILSDKHYRKHILDQVQDPVVKAFWNEEFTKYNDKYASEAVAPIQNKVGQFISNPLVRNIIGQANSKIDFRRIMDEKKILIINLSKGLIGPENMRLLGGMLVTKIYLAAMSRANMSDEALARMPTCYMYVDEFQNFANESFAEILSESRKYKLALSVANQYVEQMTEEVRAAIFGNIGSLISFRVGAVDAEYLEKEFAPIFTAEHLVNLDFAQTYLKLMIDGVGSKPFSATSLPPLPKPEKSYVEDIIAYSRQHYAVAEDVISEEINAWTITNFDPKQQYKEQAVVTSEAQSPVANSFKKDNFYNSRQDQKHQRDRRDRRDDKSEQKAEKKNSSNQANNQVKPKSEPSLLGDLIQKAMSEKAFQEPATPAVKDTPTDSQSLRDVLKLAKGGASDLKTTRQTAKSTAKNLHFIRTNSSKMIDSQKNLPDTVLKSLFDL